MRSARWQLTTLIKLAVDLAVCICEPLKRRSMPASSLLLEASFKTQQPIILRPVFGQISSVACVVGMRDVRQFLIFLHLVSVLSLLSVSRVHADTTRTQTISLKKGWNAVFLEVDPYETGPGEVFAGTPVDIAASYYASVSPSQFVSDPSSDLFSAAGWGVWYSAKRPDGFLTTLHSIYGQQAYLLHATSDFSWNVSGAAAVPKVQWRARSFNLVGFSVHAQAPPTFAEFFAGSDAHQNLKVYRMVGGSWKLVVNPQNDTLQSGEAYWIYCEKGSDYQGPLRVETSTRHGVVFNSRTDQITLRNDADHPVTATIHGIAGGETSVPMAVRITVFGDPEAPVKEVAIPRSVEGWTQELPALEAGGSVRVPLLLNAERMSEEAQTSLIRISSDIGTEVWLPVYAVRDDVQSP